MKGNDHLDWQGAYDKKHEKHL